MSSVDPRVTDRMRTDWDQRAKQDAERFIYTRDGAGDVEDFAASGLANYNQLVRPYLPMLLNGRSPRHCDAAEIGCGVGRMTEWLARDFRRIDAVDVAPAMIEAGRKRLVHCSNVLWHLGSGADLAPLGADSADLVFSYIVFQHIPSRSVIENYVREAARVLRPDGMFKFQVNGDQSPEYLNHVRDTWLGETFSGTEVEEMIGTAGLSIVALEGVGTQYLTATACRGLPTVRWVLGGDPDDRFVEGFGPAVDGSWRPLEARARVRVTGEGRRLYLGLYFWPESQPCQVRLGENRFTVTTPGDHYLEGEGEAGIVEIEIQPAPIRPPAFRIVGLY